MPGMQRKQSSQCVRLRISGVRFRPGFRVTGIIMHFDHLDRFRLAEP